MAALQPPTELPPAQSAGSETDLELDARYVQCGNGWTGQMIEMAAHIGAYRTLLISQRFGGGQIYVPANAAGTMLAKLVGEDAARVLSQVYRRERLVIPTARTALRIAKRAALLAMVRRGELSVSEAARRLGSSRTYVSYLVNHTHEGEAVAEAGSIAAE